MHLQLKNIGQITDADIRFGDLTVFVGPQASGKTIALEFLKLAVDRNAILQKFSLYGFDWSGGLSDFFNLYFGEGMSGLWRQGRSEAWWGKSRIALDQPIGRARGGKVESVFYIPAQRVLALSDGWPLPFTSFAPGVPFVVREFNEKLRQVLEGASASGVLFPLERPLNKEFRDMIDKNIFAGFKLKLETLYMRKRIVLSSGDQSLPFMVWSAGQREFVPLLLGLYWLLTPKRAAQRGNIEWVILEELEMGLHPRAIDVLILMTLELVARGYRVCLSTHSSQVIEVLWALRHLQMNGASGQALLGVFKAPSTAPMRKLAETVLTKSVKVYYFDSTRGAARDISELDVDGDEAGGDGWGGLIESSDRANNAVATAAANAERQLRT